MTTSRKPLDLDYFRGAGEPRRGEGGSCGHRIRSFQEQLIDMSGFEGIIGQSGAMQQLMQTARQVAPTDIAVLILGESGTGKELIARSIHTHSKRRKNRLVVMNCAGFAPTILEDELFGHVKGAFTGAATDREGRFEHADGGTLFLDEIGDMPHEMQAKLLRALENGEVVRLGSNEPIQVDVRIISATNKNLEEMVAEKQFRQDLFQRINGVTLQIPPLRERREDIALLIHYFLNSAAEKYNKQIEGIAPEANQVLMSYSWPGNVRELKKVIEQMIVLSTGPKLTVQNLPPEIRPAGGEIVGGMNNLVGISLEQSRKGIDP